MKNHTWVTEERLSEWRWIRDRSSETSLSAFIGGPLGVEDEATKAAECGTGMRGFRAAFLATCTVVRDG